MTGGKLFLCSLRFLLASQAKRVGNQFQLPRILRMSCREASLDVTRRAHPKCSPSPGLSPIPPCRSRNRDESSIWAQNLSPPIEDAYEGEAGRFPVVKKRGGPAEGADGRERLTFLLYPSAPGIRSSSSVPH